MKLVLENIGMLEKAEVKLDGLTVIAGENDTGKSTVGKVLFCLIKAIGRYKEDLEESQEHHITEKVEEILFQLRRYAIKYTATSREEMEEIFSQSRREIRKNVTQGNAEKIYQRLDEFYKKTKRNRLFAETNERSLFDPVSNNARQQDIEKNLSDLDNLIKNPIQEKEAIQNALKKVFQSEFSSQINSTNSQKSSIQLFDEDLVILDIELHKNKVALKNHHTDIFIQDATFIETPLILNLHDMLIRAKSGIEITQRRSAYLGVPYTTLHTKDLFDKLKERENFSLDFNTDPENSFRQNIRSIIDGEVVYSAEERDFVFVKDKQKIPIKNTATGIKSFGILQLLFDREFVAKRSYLILDEPEIHLHPKWQLQYAELIAKLAKNNIPILVTSHSPYMIEALQRYSDKEGVKEKTNFYLAKQGIIEDKSSLGEIFEQLSEPFDTFDEMDKEILLDG